MTDKEVKETGAGHVTPDASYAKEYARFYAYNEKDIDQNEADWKAFVDKVVELIDSKGKANIVIEASASKVPTRTYGSNKKLSDLRMDDAKKRLIEAVAARGKDTNALLLEAVNSLVQGPAYKGDYQETDKYGKFQYVKLKVR